MWMLDEFYPVMAKLCFLIIRQHHSAQLSHTVNPYCNLCQGVYEMAAHFVGECDRYTSRRREIWGKPYLHPDDFNM